MGQQRPQRRDLREGCRIGDKVATAGLENEMWGEGKGGGSQVAQGPS